MAFTEAKLSTFCCTVTLFDENLKWDEAASRAHFERVAKAGVGLYVGGSSPGEGYAMSADEIDRLLRPVVGVERGALEILNAFQSRHGRRGEQADRENHETACQLAAIGGLHVP